MQMLEFLSKNNEYLIVALVLAVLILLLLQYLIDYLIIGRNFERSRNRHRGFPARPTNQRAAGSDNSVELGSNRRAFPVPQQKPPLSERLRRRNNFEAKNILNVSEQRFFRLLCDNLTDCHVFPQVSFNALITHASWISRGYWQQMVRSKFNAKYVDFVVCNRLDLRVVAVIEFDGPGHQSTRDEERDSMLRGAGYRVERFTHQDTPNSIRFRFGLPNQDKNGTSGSELSAWNINQRDSSE